MFCWLEPTCRLCKTLVSTAMIQWDHLLLPLQRGNPVQKGNRCNTAPSPETSANVYGDNSIQRGCISDRAGQPCRAGHSGHSLEPTFWMPPHRKSKKRRKNLKAAFSFSLPAKTFAQAGRHLIQKCPLGTVPHGIMQGQGCCGAQPGASWCSLGVGAGAQTRDALWVQLPQGFFSAGNAAVSHRCFFSSYQTVFALQLKMQTQASPSAQPGCLQVAVSPVCLVPVHPKPSPAVGYEGKDISTWTAVTPSCSTGQASWGMLALAWMGLEVWPLLIFPTPNPAAEICRSGLGGGQTFLGDVCCPCCTLHSQS